MTRKRASKARVQKKVGSLRARGLNPKGAAGVKGGIGSATGGAGAGKVSMSEFTVKKLTDATTPK